MWFPKHHHSCVFVCLSLMNYLRVWPALPLSQLSHNLSFGDGILSSKNLGIELKKGFVLHYHRQHHSYTPPGNHRASTSTLQHTRFFANVLALCFSILSSILDICLYHCPDIKMLIATRTRNQNTNHSQNVVHTLTHPREPPSKSLAEGCC